VNSVPGEGVENMWAGKVGVSESRNTRERVREKWWEKERGRETRLEG